MQKIPVAKMPGRHKKTTPEKSCFCGIAASKPLDNHQGCLRVFSLHSHQNQLFSGAVQFCPRILDAESAKRGGASLDGLPAPLNILCAKTLRQNRCFLMPHRLRPRGFFCILLRFGKGANQRRMSAPFSTSTVRVSPVLCTPPMISLAIRVSTRLWMNRFSGRAP